MATINAVVLPGESTVRHVKTDVPEPGHGQVLLQTKASSICGSDIRAIYWEHLGTGPEAYQGVIAGHEPCGRVVTADPGCLGSAPGTGSPGTGAWCTTSPDAVPVRSAATAT